MNKILLTLLFCFSISSVYTQTEINIISWNIRDLGRTKDDSEIAAIAKILRQADLIAIQEVVAKDPAGAQKVAQLADELNRMGAKWDYRISHPTQSPSPYISERYAFLWKTSKLQNRGRPTLDEDMVTICDREPYIGAFIVKSTEEVIYLVNFHSRPHNKNPDLEVQHFHKYPDRLGSEKVIILGDFNMNEKHRVWKELYNLGFAPAIRNSPTTLKRDCDDYGNYLNHPIDNIYYPKQHLTLKQSGALDIVGNCENLAAARALSDHLPVQAVFIF